MKVEYLFSRNNKIGSRLISWAAKAEKLGLEENPSHIAVLLNNEIVIESTLSTGVRIIPYSKWLEKNRQLARIPCTNLYRPSMDVFAELTSLWGKKYDWKGILFFGLSYLRLMIFKTEMPKENLWQNKDRYFCTEFAAILSGCKCSMDSPAKLMAEWSDGVKHHG